MTSAAQGELLAALRRALRNAQLPFADAPLALMHDKGLAHHHVRIEGSGLLARLPKQSQMGLAAADNLAYEAACFERAQASGHVPAIAGLLGTSAALPRGGLMVHEVRGRPARLPHDLPAIARALAAIHSLPLPDSARRPPLLDAFDPLAALRDEIDAQAVHLDAAGLDPGVLASIAATRADFARHCHQGARPAKRLIAFDAHPGNFLISDDGRAMLVDLEKARYSHPPLDLAHATLYTSTTWDRDASAELTLEQVLGAYAQWQAHCDLGDSPRGWFAPLRAAMWLWSVTWCAKWRVLSVRAAQRSAHGEDWSQQRSTPALVAHVRDRVDCYLSRPVVDAVVHELALLQSEFGR